MSRRGQNIQIGKKQISKLKRQYTKRLVFIALWVYKSIAKQYRRISKKDLSYHGTFYDAKFRNRFVMILVGRYFNSYKHKRQKILVVQTFCCREPLMFYIITNATNVLRVRYIIRVRK